ncbi:MAG TPA: hypothetical protein VGR92_14055 [Steroidobacteraceae bacterium]|nr:hypothetical protein [Steroidobacteraceae bacterium]
MTEFFRIPDGITNVPRWEEQCRRIHARATDLVEGKLGVIQAALDLRNLASQSRAKDDSDLAVFQKICAEVLGLPVGPERQYWAKHALEREDAKIRAVEERWRLAALAAAERLVERYRWALAARQRRRMSGHLV